MMRIPCAVLVAGLVLSLAGCAAPPTSTGRLSAGVGPPGIAAYYEQLAPRRHRAVRKPVRDQQAYALQMLRNNADALLAEAETWDRDARLVSLAEDERPAARDAIVEFRHALGDLRTAAARSDVRAVRAHYARVTSSYRHLGEVFGTPD